MYVHAVTKIWFVSCKHISGQFSTSPTVANPPNIISLEQTLPTAVRVTWSPPSGGATVTGYIVHYRTDSFARTRSVSLPSTSTDITGLTTGAIYTISVEATSQHLSGESEEMTISWRKFVTNTSHTYISGLH